jgi:hypothetical protein
MDADHGSPEQQAQRLALAAGQLERVTAVQHGLIREAALTQRPADVVLADAVTAWLSGDRRQPSGVRIRELPSAPASSAPVLAAPVRWLRVTRGRRAVDVCLLASDYPGTVAVKLLMMRRGEAFMRRPGEALAVISRRADRVEIARGIEHLGTLIAGTLPLDRSGFFWCVARSPDLYPPEAERAYGKYEQGLDAASASFWALPGWGLGFTIAEEWVAFHRGPDGPTGSRSLREAVGVRVRADWAWAAVQGLIDTVDRAASDLVNRPAIGAPVHQRLTEVRKILGSGPEAAVGLVRDALRHPRSTLPDMPNRPMWRRFGIRRVAPIELDTLVVGLRRRSLARRPASLTVQLVPTWTPDGVPAVRGEDTGERLVLEINVAADPDRIRHDFWSRLASAIGLRYSVRGRPTVAGLPAGEIVHDQDGKPWYIEKRARRHSMGDLSEEPSVELVRRTIRQMDALAGRYERVEAFAAWLNDRRGEAD